MFFSLLLLVFTKITIEHSLVWPAVGETQVYAEMILTELPSEGIRGDWSGGPGKGHRAGARLLFRENQESPGLNAYLRITRVRFRYPRPALKAV